MRTAKKLKIRICLKQYDLDHARKLTKHEMIRSTREFNCVFCESIMAILMKRDGMQSQSSDMHTVHFQS